MDYDKEEFKSPLLASASALKKPINSKDYLRKFFIDVHNLYVPPNRDLTNEFCR